MKNTLTARLDLIAAALCLVPSAGFLLAWHMQVAEMRKAMAGLGGRAVSLDGDQFLAAPRQALEALDGFFGLGLSQAQLDAAARSLDRDVKTGAGGAGRQSRDAGAQRVEQALGGKLDEVIDRAARASGFDPAAPVLADPLVW